LTSYQNHVLQVKYCEVWVRGNTGSLRFTVLLGEKVEGAQNVEKEVKVV
jgi:hypothetical protein